MSDVKWIKLSTQMFDDEKIRLIEGMPEADSILIIWIKLLSQAGKTNANGYIYLSETIPYNDEMLSTIFNRPLNVVRLALTVFKQFGMIEIDENDFLSISNWEKHQNIQGLEKIKEDTRKRVQKHRENKRLAVKKEDKKPCNVTVTKCNDAELELDLELEREKDINNNNAFQFYQNNFGMINSFLSEDIGHWIDDLSEELVIEAMKRGLEQNKRNWGYVKGILKSWHSTNVKTIADVIAVDAEFQKKREGSGTSESNKGSNDQYAGYNFDKELPKGF